MRITIDKNMYTDLKKAAATGKGITIQELTQTWRKHLDDGFDDKLSKGEIAAIEKVGRQYLFATSLGDSAAQELTSSDYSAPASVKNLELRFQDYITSLSNPAADGVLFPGAKVKVTGVTRNERDGLHFSYAMNGKSENAFALKYSGESFKPLTRWVFAPVAFSVKDIKKVQNAFIRHIRDKIRPKMSDPKDATDLIQVTKQYWPAVLWPGEFVDNGRYYPSAVRSATSFPLVFRQEPIGTHGEMLCGYDPTTGRTRVIDTYGFTHRS